MTPDQIRLVQESFRAAVANPEVAATIFYQRLFAIDPGLRGMFRSTDMVRQGAKLMASLGFVVHGLDRADTLLPIVRALASRHAAFGVAEHHGESVGRALVETLAAGLGAGFTQEVREAWQAAYALLSGVVDESARTEAIAA
jgi:hemoglobin-like flavoprotein